ncbi:cyclin-domain-containing protein [Lichtheimia hyalospora FSU 10163]|nr:cyclin-domain-containing protein [Lichtheimia hyalospora FSU 10163]
MPLLSFRPFSDKSAARSRKKHNNAFVINVMATESTDTAVPKVIQVPEYFYAIDINYLTHMIADMLSRLITHNDLIPLTPSNITRFHSRTPPNISLHDYLRRIVKYASVEKACLLILLIYIDRVCELHPQFTISSLTVHRFLITAVTVSSKSLCDAYCTNSHYAKVGGISTQELNALELEFLRLIDWNLASSGAILQQYYANLIQQHPCYERLRSLDDNATDDNSVTKESNNSNNNNNTSTDTMTTTSSKPVYRYTKRTGKRRRSSTVIAEAAAATATSPSTVGDQKMVQQGKEELVEEDEEDDNNNDDDDDDEERTVRHFDTLLQRDWIPYIA